MKISPAMLCAIQMAALSGGRLVRMQRGHWTYPPGGMWAAPDVATMPDPAPVFRLGPPPERAAGYPAWRTLTRTVTALLELGIFTVVKSSAFPRRPPIATEVELSLAWLDQPHVAKIASLWRVAR